MGWGCNEQKNQKKGEKEKTNRSRNGRARAHTENWVGGRQVLMSRTHSTDEQSKGGKKKKGDPRGVAGTSPHTEGTRKVGKNGRQQNGGL